MAFITTRGHELLSEVLSESHYAPVQVRIDKPIFKQQTGDTKMTAIRTVNLTLVDNNPNLKGKAKIVYQELNYVTEHTDDRTIQQVLISGDVATALEKHNKVREQTVDKEILRTTGRDVMLEPVEIFDLQWQVVRVG